MDHVLICHIEWVVGDDFQNVVISFLNCLDLQFKASISDFIIFHGFEEDFIGTAPLRRVSCSFQFSRPKTIYVDLPDSYFVVLVVFAVEGGILLAELG